MPTQEASHSMGTIPKRSFKDGVELSIIGFGGIVVMNAEQAVADRVVAESVERGVNYFDVAPSYGDAEQHLGPALEPYRKDVFLACKTGQRERDAAEAELDGSLNRLRTDYFDLYQLHGLMSIEKDVDPVFRKGGVIDMLSEKKRAGQIRFIGFSAHTIEAAVAAMDRFDFDSVLFPLNFACYKREAFGPVVIRKAQEKGAARLALKAMARQKWADDDARRKFYSKCWYEPVTDREEADRALRWTLSLPITSAIPPGEEALFRMAMDIASDFRPISEAEDAALSMLARELDPIFQKA